jgi:hypothetical protein
MPLMKDNYVLQCYIVYSLNSSVTHSVSAICVHICKALYDRDDILGERE